MRENLNQTILISGASGYLAGALIQQLSEETEVTIYALTSNKEKLMKRFDKLDRLKVISLEEYRNGDLAWEEIDTLIHCAFSRGYNSCEKIEESLKFTKSLFKTAFENNIPKIINISSQEVYGKSNEPLWHENMLVAPESCYGIAKRNSELFAIDLKKNLDRKTIITNLRISSITGASEVLRLELVSKLVLNAIKSEPIKIVGGGQVLSYIDIRDVCSAIIALLSTDSVQWKEIYNLGSNHQYNILDIAELVVKVSEKYNLKPVKINIEPKDIQLRVGMDSGLFYQDTGWKPKYTLEDTVNSLFDFFMKEVKI